LNGAGHECVVRTVQYEQIGSGQIGASYRLHLELDAPAGNPVPRTLVAKLAAGSPEARERVKQGFQKEVCFYNELAALTDANIPHCWFAAISDDLYTFTLLLEDLAPRLPGHQASGCRLDQAAAAVTNLAALHAPLWCHPVLHDHAAWLTPMDAASGAFLGHLMVEATGQFLDRYGEALSPKDVDTLSSAAAVTGRWAGSPGETFSIAHGDYRLDNLIFDPDSADVAAVDWQTTTSGPPARDLAYFLATSLHTEQRQRNERGLVETYVRELAARGIDYPLERVWHDYRLGVMQGPLITVIGCVYATANPSPAADEMFLAMATRSCAAIRDLETLDAIG
jgi:hypothetical protein